MARKTAAWIELDVGGVGYEVWVPASVQRKMTEGQDVILLTHCHIREDLFQIFGFLREDERTLFRMLLGISGVGPKVALAVLSGLSVPEFARAVQTNDVAAFKRVPGVGQKMAQRIILEMKAKLGQDAELDEILGAPEAEHDDERDDAIAALCALGCTLPEARRAAQAARKTLGAGASDEDVLKAALRSMAKV